jgi:CxxC-x17-CxxC domain-containing protein
MSDQKPPFKKDKSSEPTGAPQPFRVGGPLNHFGTRRRRRIECEACGKADYVSFVPKADKKVFCTNCARKQLGLYEESAVLPEAMRSLECPDCSRTFEVPEYFSQEEELLCPDCHKGFETWQGAKGGSTTEKDYEKRASGAVLRRKKDVKPES